MDGTSKDSKSKGVFVRSLSSTNAVETYASIVVAIKFNKARVDSDSSYDGLNTVTVSLPNGLVYRRIPYQDYLKILIAVDQIGDQPLFQTYPEGVFEAARVRLSVLF